MIEITTLNKYSLHKTPHDPRDVRYFGSAFGKIPSLSILPANFKIGDPLFIKNQGMTDYCPTFSSTECSEDQELTELDPLFQFMNAKQIALKDYGILLDSFGCDLRSTAKSYTLVGSVEQKYSPYTINTPRKVIVDPSSWKDKAYMALAAKHKKQTYLIVSGAYDNFDNIRMVMYHAMMTYNLKQSVFMGFDWYQQYNFAPNGVVDTVGSQLVGGHAMKVYGWETDAKGVVRMLAQQSEGISYGDKGTMLFSRAVINAQQGYGAYIFVPTSMVAIQNHVDAGVFLDSNIFARIGLIIFNKIKNIWPIF